MHADLAERIDAGQVAQESSSYTKRCPFPLRAVPVLANPCGNVPTRRPDARILIDTTCTEGVR